MVSRNDPPLRNNFAAYRRETLALLNCDDKPLIPRWCMLAFPILSAILLLLALWGCQYGLDFTDESYYLTSIIHPPWVKNDIWLFGYFYHPLLRMLGGDVVRLRQASVLFHFLVSFSLCWECISLIAADNIKKHRFLALPSSLFALASGLAAAGLFTPFCGFSPSYNDLNKTAYMIAGIGMLRASASLSFRSISGWVLIAIAGYLSFLAKPISAAPLGVIILTYLIIAKKFNVTLQILCLGIFLTLLAATEIAVYGSLSDALDAIRTSLADNQLIAKFYAPGHIFRFNSPARLFRPKLHGLLSNLLLIGAGVFLLHSLKTKTKEYFIPAILFACSIILVLDSVFVGILPGMIKWIWNFDDSVGVMAWQIFILTFLWILILRGKNIFANASKERIALLICFLVFPYACSFGSGNNYLFMTAFTVIFVFLATILLFSVTVSASVFLRALLPLIALAQTLSITAVAVNMEYPYRQPKSWLEMRAETPVPNSKTPLILDQDTSDFVKTLTTTAAAHRFKSGTPLVNFSLYGRGVVFFLDAEPMGAPSLSWFAPGHESFVDRRLARIPKETLRKAWILYAPESGNENLLPVIDGHFPDWKQYELVGEFVTPPWQYGPQKMYLYKPPSRD